VGIYRESSAGGFTKTKTIWDSFSLTVNPRFLYHCGSFRLGTGGLVHSGIRLVTALQPLLPHRQQSEKDLPAATALG